MEQVRAALNLDEPNYAQAATMGPGALPHLASLIRGIDPGLASKAASLAGMIQGAESVNVLEQAANHADPRVRIAAAAACRNLGDADASHILSSLVRDADIGVQKVALQSIPDKATDELTDVVNQLSTTVTEPLISDIVRQARHRIQTVSKTQKSETGGEMPSGDMNEPQSKGDMMPSGDMENLSPGNGSVLQDMPSGVM
jgi:hypothetical protein